MLLEIITGVNTFILWYLILTGFIYIVLLITAIPNIVHQFAETKANSIDTFIDSSLAPPVTVIMPAYNEEQNILEATESVMRSNYPHVSLIVVNDSSTDNTLQKLIDTYDMHEVTPVVLELIESQDKIKAYYVSKIYKNLTVIDKEHGDRSNTLNIGINACRTPMLMTIDADTLIDEDAISQMVFTLLNKPHCVAVGGGVYILNGCEFKNGEIKKTRIPYKLLPALQACEYLRSFMFGRSGWNVFGGALSYAGAFTLIEHQAVVEIGGYQMNNFAQDFEIITHLHAYGRKNHYPFYITYNPAAISWTDVPNTMASYWQQRSNWQDGILRSLMRHKRMFFNPQYGLIGLFTYPFYFFTEGFGASVEFLAYLSLIICWFFGILNTQWAILFILICWGLVSFITMATVLISFATFNKYKKIRDLLWLFFLVMVEQFGFRQISVVCKVIATVKFFLNKLISY